MKYYAYKLAHDYGFAPNPFGGICTLATCKPKIRKKAEVGDWIIGTGSKKMGLLHHLIHIMEVTGKLSFNEYWNSPDFQFKKPTKNGSLVRIHGDNIYSESKDGGFVQMESFHSNIDGTENSQHLKRDTKGKFVIISNNFYYFGEKNFLIPEQYISLCSNSRDLVIIKDNKLAGEFIDWIKSNYAHGINGFPINWKEYKQLKILFS